MTVLETRFMETVPSLLRRIAEELKMANELKTLELKCKAKYDVTISSEMVDDIVNGKGE